MKINLFEPYFDDDEEKAVLETLRSKFWASGAGVGNVSKFFIVVFPVFVLQFFVYLAFGAIPGNEFGTTASLATNSQQILTNLLGVYAMALTILLIDDIHKEMSRPISLYI